MWSQLNVFYNWIAALDDQVLTPGRLARFLAEIERPAKPILELQRERSTATKGGPFTGSDAISSELIRQHVCSI
jgi:hypothetical protein